MITNFRTPQEVDFWHICPSVSLYQNKFIAVYKNLWKRNVPLPVSLKTRLKFAPLRLKNGIYAQHDGTIRLIFDLLFLNRTVGQNVRIFIRLAVKPMYL